MVRHAHMGGQAVPRHLQDSRRPRGSGSPPGRRREGAPRLGRQQPGRRGGVLRRVGFRPVARRAFGRFGRRFHRRRALSAARLRRRDGRGGRRRRRRPRVRPGVDGRLKGDRLLARRRLVAPMADLAPQGRLPDVGGPAALPGKRRAFHRRPLGFPRRALDRRPLVVGFDRRGASLRRRRHRRSADRRVPAASGARLLRGARRRPAPDRPQCQCRRLRGRVRPDRSVGAGRMDSRSHARGRRTDSRSRCFSRLRSDFHAFRGPAPAAVHAENGGAWVLRRSRPVAGVGRSVAGSA